MDDCKNICKNCEQCQLNKRSNKNVKYGKIPVNKCVEEKPFNTIQVDSMGPFF